MRAHEASAMKSAKKLRHVNHNTTASTVLFENVDQVIERSRALDRVLRSAIAETVPADSYLASPLSEPVELATNDGVSESGGDEDPDGRVSPADAQHNGLSRSGMRSLLDEANTSHAPVFELPALADQMGDDNGAARRVVQDRRTTDGT